MTMLASPPQQMRPQVPQYADPQAPFGEQEEPPEPGFHWPDNFDAEDFQKLKTQVSSSFKQLEHHREARLATIRQYAGSIYANADTSAQSTPRSATIVNSLAQMVRVYLQQLVSGNPQTLIVTQKLALRLAARYFEMALNHVMTQIDCQSSLEWCVHEAMFSMGVMKVGVELPKYAQRAYPFDASAIPFAEPVFFDNFVFDTAVPQWDLITFCGDRYRELKEIVEDDERNNPRAIKNLDAGQGAFVQGNTASAEHLSGTNSVYEQEHKDYVSIWDAWVPKKRLVVTYTDNDPEEPLRVTPWTGPPEGMYYPIWFEGVLDNAMPKAPVNDMAPLATVNNAIVEKLAEQASRQKTILCASVQGTKDANSIIKTRDGDVIKVTNPESCKEFRFGGIDQGSLTAMQVFDNVFSEQAGNLKSMGGLSTGADTLGQEELLKQSSSGRIQWYQSKVVKWTTKIVSALGWYLWNDPLVRVSVTDKIPGTDIDVEMKWPMQQDEFQNEYDLRQGELNDFNFSVQPYSLAPQSPQAKLAGIRGVLAEFMPMMPLLQQQGISLDLQETVRVYARLGNMPELEELFRFETPPDDPDQSPVNTGAPKPAQTTRTYDNRSTKSSDPNESMSKLIGGMSKDSAA